MKRIRTWYMALVSVFTLTMQLFGAAAPDWTPVTQPDTIIGYFVVSNVETKAFVETDGSKLAVFAENGECRGVAKVIDGPKGRYFSLSIGVASSTEKGLTLQCWDAATETAFDVNDCTIDASVAGEQIGSIISPVVLTIGAVSVVTHTVTFDLGEHGTRTGGGELVQTIEDGAAATAPTIEASEGWTFTGWDNAFDNVVADMTVMAQYEEVVLPSASVEVTGECSAGSYSTAITMSGRYRLTSAGLPDWVESLQLDVGNSHQSLDSSVRYQIVLPFHGTGTIAFKLKENTGSDRSATWTIAGDDGTDDIVVSITQKGSEVLPVVVHTVTFDLGEHGTRTGGGELVQTIEDGAAATAPTIEASEGWTFTGWDNAFDNVTADLTVTAQWTGKSYTMTVGGSDQKVTYGQQMTLRETDRVDGYAQFVCIGWTGTGDVPATGTGNEVQFTVTQDSTLTWLYQTNYWFEAKATSGGAVTVAETGCDANPSGSWVPAGATVDIAAAAKVSSAKFTAWSDLLDGGIFSEDPSLSLTMDGPYRLLAKFTGGEPSPEKDFKYTKKNGQATITGYKGIGGDVVIPETLGGVPVTAIGEKSFYGNMALESVYVPNGVVEIGDEAFFTCRNLKSVDLPSSLLAIGDYAFSHDQSLISFAIDDSNEKYAVVDGVLFSKDLATLEIYPAGRTCDHYEVPETVDTIQAFAFYACSEIQSLVIPETVTTIGDWALYLSSIKKLTIEGRCGHQYMMVGTEKANIWVKAEDYDYWTEIFGLGISVIEAEGTTYDIAFDANGGYGEMSGLANVAQGVVTNLPACTFENASAPIFFGWALTPDGDVVIADEEEVSSLAQEGGTVVTLYAVWSSYHVRAGEAGTIAPPESTLNYPTWSAKGLPKGMKIAPNSYSAWLSNGAYMPAGTIYGTATVPGSYVVKVTAKSGTVSETFDITVVIGNYLDESLPLEDNYAAQVGMKSLIELGEDFAGAKATGLPSGFKFAAKATTDKTFGEIAAGTIYGIPSKAATNCVIFTKKDGTVTHKASTMVAVAAAPVWSVGTFNGRLDDGSGSATFTVAANGKISGKVIRGGKTWSFSASGYEARTEDETESLTVLATAKNGKETASVCLMVSAEGVQGSIAIETSDDDGPLLIDAALTLWRNEWKDKGATDKVKPYAGLYTVQLMGGDFGTGYLSLTLDAKGNCKATGKLPDGTSASGTLPLVWDAQADAPMAIWQIAPSAYKGGHVGGLLKWSVLEDDVGATVTCDEIAWVSCAPTASSEYGTGFDRQLAASGAYYNKLVTLSDYYSTVAFSTTLPGLDATVKTTDYDDDGKKITTSEQTVIDAVEPSCWGNLTISLNANGAAFAVDQGKATKPVQDRDTKEWSYEGENDAALTFTFAKATGIFKGSFTCWFDYTSATDNTKDPAKETLTHTSKKFSYEGVMVIGEPLRGFYSWDRTGTYTDEKTNKEKTYKYKESGPIAFE